MTALRLTICVIYICSALVITTVKSKIDARVVVLLTAAGIVAIFKEGNYAK